MQISAHAARMRFVSQAATAWGVKACVLGAGAPAVLPARRAQPFGTPLRHTAVGSFNQINI